MINKFIVAVGNPQYKCDVKTFNNGDKEGVKDILIACVDGLKSFPEAINTISTYPDPPVPDPSGA